MTASADRRDPEPPVSAVRRIPAEYGAVRAFLGTLQTCPALGTLGPARRVDLELLLGEILNNIVEHAMAGRRDGWIEVALDVQDDALAIALADDGAALPAPLLHRPDRPAPSAPPDEVSEGGYGWFLIHILAEDIAYRRADGLNRLTLRFALP